MSKNAQRLSQVVSTFGPGAMVDLPTRSLVIGGLELWDMRGGSFTTIPEPRLTMRLEQLLKSQNRLADTKHLSLRTPPVTDGKPGQPTINRATTVATAQHTEPPATAACSSRRRVARCGICFWTGICSYRRWQWTAPRSLTLQHVEPRGTVSGPRL
jgi:hypothetical protein